MSPPAPDAPHLDAAAFRRRLARAAPLYGASAALPSAVAARLREGLELMRLDPAHILMADARTGMDRGDLQGMFPRARLTLTDPAPAMLARSRPGLLRRRHSRCAAWSQQLPFPDAAFGLVWSNLALHWSEDPEPVLRELARVLEPGGLLMLASLGPDTLADLRAALVTAYADPPSLPVFLDMHDLGDAMGRAGFEGVVMEAESWTVTYSDLRALMREGRATGAVSVRSDRPRGLMTPRRLAALEASMPWSEGRMATTFEVVYGHAWRSAAPAGAAGPEGLFRIAPDNIGRGP